jgi:hypothetical protein
MWRGSRLTPDTSQRDNVRYAVGRARDIESALDANVASTADT